MKDADLGLGCGIPTESAGIKEGHTVIDLGSGAGNDAFVARRVVGPTGHVYGIDFTPRMIERARINASKLGYTNVEFLQGDIENLPLRDNLANVVVSNCVINLVPDKGKAFKEMYRVLKPGGQFSISDMVLTGELPPKLREVAELYAGCISGTTTMDHYLQLLSDAGFNSASIVRERNIDIPDALLEKHLSDAELAKVRSEGTQIKSVTFVGRKPA